MTSPLDAFRHWLESINPGLPWLVLFGGLGTLAMVLKHPAIQGLLLRFLGESRAKHLNAVIVAAVATLGAFWPEMTSASLSPKTDQALGLFAGLVAAILGTWTPPPPAGGSPGSNPGAGSGSSPPSTPVGSGVARDLTLMLALLACAGCGGLTKEQRIARETCYAQADAQAFAAYLRECRDFSDDFDACPAAKTIEENHKSAQEACP